jgi:hypothetical protein
MKACAAEKAADSGIGKRMRRKSAAVCNLLIAGIVLYSWIRMLSGIDAGGLFSESRIRTLKYFTVDSNLLAGAAALCAALFEFRSGKEIPVWVSALKLAATASVMLTFLTVIGFLGPIFGYASMFTGANLYMHLITPLLAAAVFCLLEGTPALSLRHCFFAVIPMLIYGEVYLLNILINGTGSGMNTNDWYGFTRWGLAAAPLVYLVMASVTWGIAWLLWRCSIYCLTRSTVGGR